MPEAVSRRRAALFIASGIAASMMHGAPARAADTLDMGTFFVEPILEAIHIASEYKGYGELQGTDRTRRWELRVETGYGLTDALTLHAAPRIEHAARFGNGTDQATGLRAVDLDLRARILKRGDFVLSVQPWFRMPGNLNRGDDNPIRTRRPEAELRVLASYPVEVWSRSVTLTGQVAHRRRLGTDYGEWRIDLSASVEVSDTVDLSLASYNLLEAAGTTREHQVDVTVGVRLADDLTLRVGAYDTVLGRDVARERALHVGLRRTF